MFGFVTKKAFDALALDLECERVHSKKQAEDAKASIEALRQINKLIRFENKSLQTANRELIQEADRLKLDLIKAEQELKGMRLKLQSIEARWGQEAGI